MEEPSKKRKIADICAALDEASDVSEVRRLLAQEADDTDRLQGPLRIRRHVLKFEKALSNNQELRIKFQNQPGKFMDSEIKLNEEIELLTQELISDPSSYREFIRLSALESCLSLLSHDNVDISISVVRLFHSMFDIESQEDETHLKYLMDAIIKVEGLPIIVETLHRFDEKEEDDREAVNLLLSTMESMIEIKNEPNIATIIVETTSILTVLLDRIAVIRKSFDENRYAAADLLVVLLLSGGPPVRSSFSPDLIQKVMSLLQYFMDKDPSGGEEKGLADNLSSALCCILLEPSKRQIFEECAGIPFCINCIKSKKYVRHGALKVLNLAVQRCGSSCELLIEIGGLKTVFAAFMTGKSKYHRKYKMSSEEDEECIVSIIANMFMLTKDVHYQRLLAKFSEKDFEKIDRLVELHVQFDERSNESEEGNALFALEMTDLVLAFVLTAGEPSLRNHAEKLIGQYKIELEDIRGSLQNLHDEISDESQESDEAGEFQRSVIAGLIAAL